MVEPCPLSCTCMLGFTAKTVCFRAKCKLPRGGLPRACTGSPKTFTQRQVLAARIHEQAGPQPTRARCACASSPTTSTRSSRWTRYRRSTSASRGPRPFHAALPRSCRLTGEPDEARRAVDKGQTQGRAACAKDTAERGKEMRSVAMFFPPGVATPGVASRSSSQQQHQPPPGSCHPASSASAHPPPPA